MSSATNLLPIGELVEPEAAGDLTAVVRDAYESETALYPVGGGTSLDYGLPAKLDGLGVGLSKLNRVVDYPARDMTITVEAGLTMEQLAETLAEHRQQLPVDVPRSSAATVGGVIATGFNGPRRLGCGGIRDFVIGISAVDGRGREFQGGGRVVKNVAGYDFCKLLTGSLGTLGVISQVTLKLRPLPERTALIAARLEDYDQAERLLAALVDSRTTPTAVELLTGSDWRDSIFAVGAADADGSLETAADKLPADELPADKLLPADASAITLVVRFEGTETEVAWMVEQLGREWNERGLTDEDFLTLDEDVAQRVWEQLVEFPAGDSPLVLKAGMVPSQVTRFMREAAQSDPPIAMQAHAGTGTVILRFAEFPADGLSRTLVGKLEPLAGRGHGNVVVLSNPGGVEMTHQSAWGGIDAPFDLMTRVKAQFDPKNLLNPGRFVYQ